MHFGCQSLISNPILADIFGWTLNFSFSRLLWLKWWLVRKVWGAGKMYQLHWTSSFSNCTQAVTVTIYMFHHRFIQFHKFSFNVKLIIVAATYLFCIREFQTRAHPKIVEDLSFRRILHTITFHFQMLKGFVDKLWGACCDKCCRQHGGGDSPSQPSGEKESEMWRQQSRLGQTAGQTWGLPSSDAADTVDTGVPRGWPGEH